MTRWDKPDADPLADVIAEQQEAWDSGVYDDLTDEEKKEVYGHESSSQKES